MAQDEDETDKPHEATQHKLDEARKKGEIARSADLNTAGSYAGLLLALMVAGPSMTEQAGGLLLIFFDQPERFATQIFDGGRAASALGGLLWQILVALVVLFLVPAAGALLSVIAQRSFIVAPEKLEPKLSRISPIKTAKNKFGMTGLFEFAKSFAKIALFSVSLGVFLIWNLSEMIGVLQADAAMVGALMSRLLIEFLMLGVVITLVVGVVDYFWQRHDHLRHQRMSHQDVRDEVKQNEGDPALKQQRRRRGMEIASSQMIAEVASADVILVNPTHYAVALKWSRTPGSAPVCVAKGMDHVARAIRERAQENGVPIRQDPPVARALFAATELGQEIDPSFFAAVAVAIRFADDMRRKARHFG